jgi:hypothetical protein
MAHRLILDLPIHCQFLAAPVRWEVIKPQRDTGGYYDLRCHLKRHAKATTIDPWQERAEFLRLPLDPSHPRFHRAPERLIEFLNRVGVWEQPSFIDRRLEGTVLSTGHVVYGQPMRDLSFFWETQMLLEDLMNDESSLFREGYLRSKRPQNWAEAEGIAERQDIFSLTFDWGKRVPRPTITTVCFWNAVLLTLQIDLVKGTRFRTCARPDCGIPYPITNRHKRKYCSQYCGHIESLRRKRGTSPRKTTIALKGS